MDSVLHTTLYRIMKSMMRILYRKGVALQDFTDLVRQAYVDAVERELAAAGERVTTTRIAAITGLNRKSVTQLRQQQNETGTTSSASRSERVVSGWVNDEQFHNQAGEPALLPFRSEQNKAGFEQLIQRYSGDMSSFAMLDEMLRLGVVEKLDGDIIRLKNKVFIPHDDEQEKIRLLGVDVALLIDTIDHNLVTDSRLDLRYQRKVSYNSVPESVLPEFRQFVRDDAQELLLRFNTWLALHDRDSNPAGSWQGENCEVGVGIYYFEKAAENTESNNEK